MRWRLGIVVATILMVVVILPARAHAQRAPDLATLDRGDGITRLGFDLDLSVAKGNPYDLVLRPELFGQYVTRRGFGFYGAIPFARSIGDDNDPPGDQDTFAIGNLELGLLYVIDSRDLSWVFRAGVALPTASDGRDGALTNAIGTMPRLTDLALTVPNAVYARAGISPLLHLHRFMLRADLGLDIGFDDTDAAQELVRFNLGAGYDFGTVALGLELVNLATLDDFGGGEKFLHTLALTFRFMGKQLQPFISVGAPLDDSVRTRVRMFVAAGIQVVFK